MMERIEDIDPWNSEQPSVTLKEAIDLSKLSNGVTMEIDVEASQQISCNSDEECFEREDILQHLNMECIDLGGSEDTSDSEDSNLTPFEKMAREMSEVPGTNGNVLKKILCKGIGDVVPEGATVRVHYNGYLEYSDEPYDSSRLRNRALQFKLGQGEVIEGWDVGVSTMRKSELARFLVNPSYAFGDFGCPPRIPPGATIMFEIELMGFVDYKAADEFSSLSKKEQREASLDQLIAVANAEREAGNDWFKQNSYGKASSKYYKAVRLLEGAHLKDEKDEKEWKQVLLKLYLNQSLVSLKMNKYRLAIAQCRKALDIEPNNVKANFRLGRAYMQVGEFKKSKDYLMKAGRLSPSNQEIRYELVKLDRTVTKYRAMEKAMCSKMVEFSAASPEEPKKESSKAAANKEVMETIRKEFEKQLTVMKNKESMSQMVLPRTLPPEQEECAKEVAHELGLKTEKATGSGLRIYKEEELVDIYGQ